jgi:hypothetical protein
MSEEMMYDGDTAVAKRDLSATPVYREVENLRKIRERLEKQFAILRERLDPLMAGAVPSPPSPELSQPDGRKSTGTHSTALAEIREGFESLYARMQDVTERLEI